MFRVLTVIVAIAALAISAAPASAATSKKPPTRITAYTMQNSMISGYGAKAQLTLEFKAKSKVNGGSNGIIAVLIG